MWCEAAALRSISFVCRERLSVLNITVMKRARFLDKRATKSSTLKLVCRMMARERNPVEFFVVRNCYLRRRVEAHHCAVTGDVTVALTLDDEANFLKRPDAFSARDDRKLGHAATSTIST